MSSDWHTDGTRREKSVHCEAAEALTTWLAAVPATRGPLFRRLHRGGVVGTTALTGDHVARMVQRRARSAGLDDDWAARGLRAGYVTEAGRQGVPLGDVMAMIEHRGVATVIGYFQPGSLLASRTSTLLSGVRGADSRPTERASVAASTRDNTG